MRLLIIKLLTDTDHQLYLKISKFNHWLRMIERTDINSVLLVLQELVKNSLVER